MAITIPEADKQAALLRLLTWLSPAFPVGAFSYSHGVERAVRDGVICDRASLLGWLTDLIERGSAWNDAVLLVEAWRGGDVAELAEAMAGSRERHMETMLQGEAFGAAVTAWKNGLEGAPYPVVVGQAAAAHGISLNDTLTAYLHAFASNLVQAAMRLVPLGQRDGVATIAALEPVIIEASKRAAGSTLDDLGSSTFLSDVISMKHEIQYSRVFRS